MKRTHLCLMTFAVLIVMIPAMAQHSDVKGSLGIYGSAKKLVGGSVDRDIISPMISVKLSHAIVPALTISLNGGYGLTYPKERPEAGGL